MASSYSFEAPVSGSALGEFSVDTTGLLVLPPAGTGDCQVYAAAKVYYGRKTDGTGKFATIDASTWTTITGCPDGIWLKADSGTVAGELDALAIEHSAAGR